MRYPLLLLLTAVMSAGCGGGEPRLPVFEAGRNVAVLEGAQLGAGTTPHDQLRKPLRVRVSNPLEALEVETAWALRPRDFDQSTLLLTQVTHVGAEPQCFIEVDGLSFVDEAGTPLEPAEQSWVFGSVGDVGRTGQPLYTDTCLDTGETGYILQVINSDAQGRAYDRVAEVRFGWTPNAHSPVRTPEAAVQAQRYEALPGGEVRVHFLNTGSRPADLTNHFTRILLLDDAGSPLFWGFAMDAFSPADFLLQPGESGSGDETNNFKLYAGAGTRLKVFINFEAEPSGGALRAPGPEGLDVKAYLRQRAQAQAALLRR